jgi:hypothetical protein
VEIRSPDNKEIGELKMKHGNSTAIKRPQRRKRREKPPVEIVGGELRVWRDRHTDRIVIDSPVFAPEKRLISLTARHARHLASSLLLFAAETESSPSFTAATSSNRVMQDADQST